MRGKVFGTALGEGSRLPHKPQDRISCTQDPTSNPPRRPRPTGRGLWQGHSRPAPAKSCCCPPPTRGTSQPRRALAGRFLKCPFLSCPGVQSAQIPRQSVATIAKVAALFKKHPPLSTALLWGITPLEPSVPCQHPSSTRWNVWVPREPCSTQTSQEIWVGMGQWAPLFIKSGVLIKLGSSKRVSPVPARGHPSQLYS